MVHMLKDVDRCVFLAPLVTSAFSPRIGFWFQLTYANFEVVLSVPPRVHVTQ